MNDAGFDLGQAARDFAFRLFAEPLAPIPERFEQLPLTRHSETLGAFPNWYLALTEMVLRDPRAEAYLLCQDDVIFAKGLRGYLESRLWPAPALGVVSIYCPSHYLRERRPGFHVESRGWNSWGAIAYAFANPSARRLLTDPAVLDHRGFGPRHGLKNIDSVVGAFCKRTGLAYYVHTPSLAQHIGDASTLWNGPAARGRRKAADFIPEI